MTIVVLEFVKDMKLDNPRRNFLMGKLPSAFQNQLQNHQSFDDYMQKLSHQFSDEHF